MNHDVFILLGKRFVFVQRVPQSQAISTCQRYARMNTIAAHMPSNGGEVEFNFRQMPAANAPRFIGVVV